MSAFANCGHGVAYVQGSYVPIFVNRRPKFARRNTLSTAAGAEHVIKLILINAIFPDWQRMVCLRYCAEPYDEHSFEGQQLT
jgi:hypothetical protein